MVSPVYLEAKKVADAGEYRTLPVSRELYADSLTPLMALRRLKNVSKHVFLLESVEKSRRWGRYTFLGFDPAMELTCLNGTLTVRAGSAVTMDTSDPSAVIRQVLRDNKSPRLPGLPPFAGGLVGYFSYDYIKYSEPSLRLDARDEDGYKDVDLMLFDKVIAFDNDRQKVVLIVNIRLSDVETEYRRAEMELENLKRLLLAGEARKEVPGKMTSPVRALFDEGTYCAMVAKAKEHIREGDIFQVVLSNRLDADFEGSLLDTYRVLRTTNPSPCMFYFSSDEIEIAGASPETLVKLEDGILHTFPLAGTRPRGRTGEEDRQLEAELLQDEKELAEHNMLVDLERIDLGKISRFGKYRERGHGARGGVFPQQRLEVSPSLRGQGLKRQL